jgi:hypothetical protein
MGPKIVVDESVPVERHSAIVEVVRSAVAHREDADSLIAVVTRLPSGRLTVFINHLNDSSVISAIEAALVGLTQRTLRAGTTES